ncbi:MAG: bifunctional UDP-N-acetylglucosamine diphosphorylase/glucosamine-1-phosphate N-acetyltransferase GlmU [Pseudomonadota bacterium]
MGGRSLAVVLAAGKGTRMRSKTPKVMHEIGGWPMVRHVLAAVAQSGVEDSALVVAVESDWAYSMSHGAAVFVQDPPQGTAHAVLAARAAMIAAHDVVVVLFGDTPLVLPETISSMVERVRAGADVAVLAFEPEDPTGYGRLLTDDGKLVAIREERDASPDEKAVGLSNSGIMALSARAVEALGDINNDNAKGEFYLTDIVSIGAARGYEMVVEMANREEVMGVNDRAQLAAAEEIFQARKRAQAMEHATLLAPHTVIFSHDTALKEDVVVEPYVVFGPKVWVGPAARIRAFCHLEDVYVGEGAVVGPYARLRPGTWVEENARIGNFVEIKNASVGEGAKVNHLAYVGDARVGAGANLGAGTITCNYDGINKFRTTIEAGAFVGSNSALVAPVTIGARAYVGSGSVVTEDVPADALAIGRGRQVNKPGRSPAAKPKG